MQVNRRILYTPALSTGGGGFTPTTWNSSDISLGNLDGTKLIFTNTAPGGGNDGGTRAVSFKSAGKYYFECTSAGVSPGGGDTCAGIANSSPSPTTIAVSVTDAVALFPSGNLWIQGVNARPGATASFALSAVTIGIAVDLGTQTVWVTINGSTWSGGSGTPSAGTGGNSFSGITGPYAPVVVSNAGDSMTWTANFGGSAFTYTLPTGFTGWPA